MINPVAAMAELLRTALRGIDGVRHAGGPGSAIDPPCTLLGLPTLTWDGYDADPVGASFPVFVIVASGDRVSEQLWSLLPRVATALDDIPDVVVRTAEPGTYPTGSGTELPAYLITVEAGLS